MGRDDGELGDTGRRDAGVEGRPHRRVHRSSCQGTYLGDGRRTGWLGKAAADGRGGHAKLRGRAATGSRVMMMEVTVEAA
jgi:hypothetical protein